MAWRVVLVAGVVAGIGACASQEKKGAAKPAAPDQPAKTAGPAQPAKPADAGAAAVSATEDGFRRIFKVDPSALKATGKSDYFDLTPGTVRLYRGGDTQLVITVLDQTRMVDGVETRIVEERESEGGNLVEVSRNFFAIDPASGDVYYFGEEVDVYKNGRVTGHPGAWQSGRGGAKFGLALPGNPAVGDRYYQEVAPGVAMDRGEVVSVSESVATPAGGYDRCVHVRETTPLEKDVSGKWYAPGIGLIKDDELELLSYTTGK